MLCLYFFFYTKRRAHYKRRVPQARGSAGDDYLGFFLCRLYIYSFFRRLLYIIYVYDYIYIVYILFLYL